MALDLDDVFFSRQVILVLSGLPMCMLCKYSFHDLGWSPQNYLSISTELSHILG